MSATPPIVNCPQCGEATEFAPSNRFRPFCSERCRVMDLGAWASDHYRVAGDPLDDDILSEGNGDLATAPDSGGKGPGGQTRRQS